MCLVILTHKVRPLPIPPPLLLLHSGASKPPPSHIPVSFCLPACLTCVTLPYMTKKENTFLSLFKKKFRAGSPYEAPEKEREERGARSWYRKIGSAVSRRIMRGKGRRKRYFLKRAQQGDKDPFFRQGNVSLKVQPNRPMVNPSIPPKRFYEGHLNFCPHHPLMEGDFGFYPTFFASPPPLPPPRTNGHLDGGRGLRHVRRGVNSAERIGRGLEIWGGGSHQVLVKKALKTLTNVSKKIRPYPKKQCQGIKVISFSPVINFWPASFSRLWSFSLLSIAAKSSIKR